MRTQLCFWLVDSYFITMSSCGLSSVCPWRERERSLVSVLFLLETPVLVDYSPTFMASFNLNYFPKGPIYNAVTLGVRASTFEFKVVHNKDLSTYQCSVMLISQLPYCLCYHLNVFLIFTIQSIKYKKKKNHLQFLFRNQKKTYLTFPTKFSILNFK